jgi:hypothetical protein
LFIVSVSEIGQAPIMIFIDASIEGWRATGYHIDSTKRLMDFRASTSKARPGSSTDLFDGCGKNSFAVKSTENI